MTPTDLAIVITCARQLLGTDLAAKSKASEIIAAWKAVESCEAHHASMSTPDAPAQENH